MIQLRTRWAGVLFTLLCIIAVAVIMITEVQMNIRSLNDFHLKPKWEDPTEPTLTTEFTVTETLADEQNLIEHYVSVTDKSLLNLRCNSCAFVTSSGQLGGSEKGKEIDSYECVIRTNHSPTYKFQQDVGIKTSIRVVAFSSQSQFTANINDVNKIHQNERNGTKVVAWGPAHKMGEKGQFGKLLRSLQKKFPLMKYYELDNNGHSQADELYKELTGIDRIKSGTWLSTGFFTMLLARKVCRVTNVYGMTDAGYCNRVRGSNGSIEEKPYHYDNAKGKECDHILGQAHNKNGHRFEIEKKLFKRWSDTEHDIFFKFPEWE